MRARGPRIIEKSVSGFSNFCLLKEARKDQLPRLGKLEIDSFAKKRAKNLSRVLER